jgi:CheY-like chemotaxis protein
MATPEAALCALRRHQDIAGAVLDVALQGGAVYPLANALRQRGVPFVLCTGHSRDLVASAFRDTVCCEKPLPAAKVVLALQAELARLLGKPLAPWPGG